MMDTKHARTFFIILSVVLLVALYMPAEHASPSYEPLWPEGAPGTQGNAKIDQPAIMLFPAPKGKATGAAVVICPGGAYKVLMDSYEGADIAKWLNSIGVTAAVLRYRLSPQYHYPAELNDALRAIRYMRYHAHDLGIAPDRIGVMGFSAGGHLASLAATHYMDAELMLSDPVDGVGSRPDFMLLGYPVITALPPYAHEYSIVQLLGNKPSDAQRRAVSSELHVDSKTPPTFLFHTGADTGVPSENSVMFYMALRKAGVPAELHIYEKGPHGAGLADGKDGTPDLPALATWHALAKNWMQGRGLLSRSQR